MAIQQHPIPQNVTQYQFRLVGDMTLKQFLQLAGGIVIALIFYASPLPFFLKWPAIAIFVAAGASMAFLPVEGRPLDQWIVAFFRSIYTPTIYTWQKPGQPATAPTTTPTKAATPQPTVTPLTPITTGNTRVPTTPLIKPLTKPSEGPTKYYPVTTERKLQVPTPTPGTTIPTPLHPTAVAIKRSAKTIFATPPKPFQVEKQERPQGQSQEEVVDRSTPTTVTTPATKAVAATGATTFSTTLPIPHPPETPNTIVGMTLTPDSKILDSAIVEILKSGSTIRATKSNKLGQFLFAKPLEDGEYQLTAEKEGHTFPVFNLKLDSKTVPPIQLKANS